MRKQEKMSVLCSAVGMLLLILDGKTALQGAQEGLGLCIKTVIPALFPFFVLSSQLTGSIHGSFLRPFGKLFRLPQGVDSLLIPGILGGYPAGAQSVEQCYQSGRISKDQAQRMLAFCNNAGPSFLFGMIAPQFQAPLAGWLLWGIHLSGALFVSRILPKDDETVHLTEVYDTITLPQALNHGLKTTAIVCGWVILFRIIITFLSRWFLWLFPVWIQVFLTGLLELSNGCCNLGQVECEGLRFILCAALLGFGGLCVTMQTASVTGELSLEYYGLGKLIQTGVSVVFAYFVQLFFEDRIHISGFWLTVYSVGVLILAFYVSKRKFNSSNPQPVRV